jgi:hypothetical protein
VLDAAGRGMRDRILWFGGDRENVYCQYVPRHGQLRFGGTYDTCAGIEGGNMGLGEFLDRLNITDEDIRKARKARELSK